MGQEYYIGQEKLLGQEIIAGHWNSLVQEAETVYTNLECHVIVDGARKLNRARKWHGVRKFTGARYNCYALKFSSARG